MKKKIKKYGKGGKTNPPIITNDPKDPRLQAYNDSLDLYNSYQNLKNNLKRANYVVAEPTGAPLSVNDLIQTIDTGQKHDSRNVFEKAINWFSPEDLSLARRGNLYQTLDFYPGIVNKDLGVQLFSNKIKPKSSDFYRKHRYAGDARLVLNYDNVKPVQPIIYKPKDDWELEARKKAGLQFDNSGMAFAQVKMDSKTGKPIGDVEFISGYNRPKEQPINLPTQTINQLPTQPLQFEEIQRVPFKKGTYFTRERQSQEAGANGMLDYFDKKTGKLLGTFENEGQNIEEMKKGGIHIKESKKGTLHTALGVPQGEKIPASKLKIKESDSPALKKKKQFAINASKWNKKDDGGWNMYSTGFDPTVSQFTPPQNLQELSVQMPDYQLNERKWATPVAPTGTENLTELKDFKSYNTKKPNVSLNSLNMFPLTGNKYLNKGLMYTNQAIKHGMNINNPNPNMSPDYNFKNGGYLPMYQNAGLNLNPANDMHYNWNENISGLPSQSDTFSSSSVNPQSFTPIADDTQQNNKGGNFNNIMQGVAAGVNATQGLINFGKGSLDIIGSQLQNKQAQKQEAQLYSQSVYSQAMDTRPQDYIYNRNALAENGKQIKEIGGKGMPNIEVEDKEAIMLPNGFSQEISGLKHSEGGIPLNLPIGSKVFSEKLKIETPKGKKSYADLAKPFETKKNVDMLESKYADKTQKETAKLMIDKKNQELNSLFMQQEQDKITGKHGKAVQNEAINDLYMEYGGMKKAGNGLLTQKGYNAIDQYENTKGTTQGTSMNMGAGYSKSQEQKIKTFIENSIGLDTWNKMPENLKVQAYSWIFNHGTDSSVWKGLAQAVDFNKYAKGNTDMDEARRNIKESDAIATLKNANFSNDVYSNYVNQVLPAQYQSIADNYSGGFDKGQEIYRNTWKNRTSDINSFLNQTPASTPIQQTSSNWMQDTFKTKEGKITPKNVDLNKNPLLDWRPFKDKWREEAIKTGQLKPNEDFKSVAELQEFAYDWALDNNPQLLKDMWKEFGITNKDEGKYSKYNVDNLSIKDLNELRGNFIDNYKGRRIFNPKLPANAQQIPATIPTTQDPVEKIVFKDRVINNTPNVNLDGINIGIPLPNVYSRTPLNYYKVNPNYVDPRYLNVEDQLNQVAQGQRAVQNNLGSRTTADISNILQSQINAYKQNQGIYSNKYNYDAAQDSQAQQFNAQAKTQADQYNQSSWFQQLEDPIRRRESAIGDQQLLDAYKAQKRFDKSIAYENTRDLIDATYSQYQNMTPDQIIANLPSKNFENYLLANYQPKKSKSGGKLKIKPSLKKKK